METLMPAWSSTTALSHRRTSSTMSRGKGLNKCSRWFLASKRLTWVQQSSLALSQSRPSTSTTRRLSICSSKAFKRPNSTIQIWNQAMWRSFWASVNSISVTHARSPSRHLWHWTENYWSLNCQAYFTAVCRALSRSITRSALKSCKYKSWTSKIWRQIGKLERPVNSLCDSKNFLQKVTARKVNKSLNCAAMITRTLLCTTLGSASLSTVKTQCRH